jgi:hypothetical protein
MNAVCSHLDTIELTELSPFGAVADDALVTSPGGRSHLAREGGQDASIEIDEYDGSSAGEGAPPDGVATFLIIDDECESRKAAACAATHGGRVGFVVRCRRAGCADRRGGGPRSWAATCATTAAWPAASAANLAAPEMSRAAAFEAPAALFASLIRISPRTQARAARIASRGRSSSWRLRSKWCGTCWAQAGAHKAKEYAVEHIHIWRLQDGKVIEHWSVRDDLRQALQLGLIGG